MLANPNKSILRYQCSNHLNSCAATSKTGLAGVKFYNNKLPLSARNPSVSDQNLLRSPGLAFQWNLLRLLTSNVAEWSSLASDEL